MNMKKVFGVLLLIVTTTIVLAGLYALVVAFSIGVMGGPCPSPSRMGEARVAGMAIGVIAVAIIGLGIAIGKIGLSLSKSKTEGSNNEVHRIQKGSK